jgi:hypothetical protein
MVFISNLTYFIIHLIVMSKIPKRVKKLNRIEYLSNEECQDPSLFLAEMFMNYHLKEIRLDLRILLSAALSSDNNYVKAIERSNVIFLLENLNKLAEASYLLNQRKNHLQYCA